MKQLLHILVLLFIANIAVAQAPQGIPYQAAARNSSGAVLASTAISVRFTIRDSIATGAIKYRETHSVTTTAQGMFSVNVGQGTVVSGTFAGINWATNAKFLQVEMDPAGGSSYIELGTQQMMSVPYALYASQAANTLVAGHTTNIGFNTSSTWTCPPGVTQIRVQLWGGGGGGGGGSRGTSTLGCPISCCGGFCSQREGRCGGAGGNGGYNMSELNVIPGTTYLITVGNGGVGGGEGADGGNGQSSSFSSMLIAEGGTKGTAAGVSTGSCWSGSNGSSGAVINYSPVDITYYTTNSTSDRSYIPTSYVTNGIFPSCCSSGGGGGSAYCYVIYASGCAMGCCGGGSTSGGGGQNGYCVISY